MITLSSSTIAMLYLSMTLGILLTIWIYQHFIGKKKKLVTAAKKLHVCEYCHFPYLESIGKEVTKCPQCHCYNKKS